VFDHDGSDDGGGWACNSVFTKVLLRFFLLQKHQRTKDERARLFDSSVPTLVLYSRNNGIAPTW
jgi:hypothetical protein